MYDTKIAQRFEAASRLTTAATPVLELTRDALRVADALQRRACDGAVEHRSVPLRVRGYEHDPYVFGHEYVARLPLTKRHLDHSVQLARQRPWDTHAQRHAAAGLGDCLERRYLRVQRRTERVVHNPPSVLQTKPGLAHEMKYSPRSLGLGPQRSYASAAYAAFNSFVVNTNDMDG